MQLEYRAIVWRNITSDDLVAETVEGVGATLDEAVRNALVGRDPSDRDWVVWTHVRVLDQ